MKKIIEITFKKFNFYFYTFKLDTYGGFINDLIFIKKIRNYKKTNSIICLVKNPYHNKFAKGSKIFFPPATVLIAMIKSLKISEIFFSIFFSIFLNIQIFISKFIFFGRLRSFFFFELGYSSRNSENLTYLQFNINKELSLTDSYSDYLNLKKSSKDKNFITFCVKDINYQKIKPEVTTEQSAKSNDYISSIKYLTKKYTILRIGDPSMDRMNYNNQNFHDFTKVSNHFEMQFDSFFKSYFYFGTASSHSYIANLTKTKKFMSNCTDFHGLQATFDYESYLIFKKVFDIKQKKILSLEEIYLDNHIFKMLDRYLKKNYIFIDNTEDENLLLAREIGVNNQNFKCDSLTDFDEIRKVYLKSEQNSKKINDIENFVFLKSAFCNIPKWYLKKYLYQNDVLIEFSENFRKIYEKNYR